jgi:hypothetical protein
MSQATRRFRLVLLTLVFALVGCGQASYRFVEVEGILTLQGKPLDNMLVQFLPDVTKENQGPHSTAITDDKGHFRLKAHTGQDGAVIGWHCVVLEDLNVDRPAQGKPHKNPPRIAASFNSAAKSSLKIQVVEGQKEYPIKLN